MNLAAIPTITRPCNYSQFFMDLRDALARELEAIRQHMKNMHANIHGGSPAQTRGTPHVVQPASEPGWFFLLNMRGYPREQDSTPALISGSTSQCSSGRPPNQERIFSTSLRDRQTRCGRGSGIRHRCSIPTNWIGALMERDLLHCLANAVGRSIGKW